MEVSRQVVRVLVDALAAAELGERVSTAGLAAKCSCLGEREVSALLHEARINAVPNTSGKSPGPPKRVAKKAKR